MESDLFPIIDHRLLPDRPGVRAGALERRRALDAAGLDPAHNDPPDAFQRDPDGRLRLQKKPFRRRRASPDGLERRNLGGGAPPVQRLERRPRAVRRVPRLGGRRSSQFLRARPAQRDDLSRAELGSDDRRRRIGRHHVDRSARGPAPAAVWRVTDGDVTTFVASEWPVQARRKPPLSPNRQRPVSGRDIVSRLPASPRAQCRAA